MKDQSNYFNQRMQELGIDPKTYTMSTKFYETQTDKHNGGEPKHTEDNPVFEEEEDGSIRINYFNRLGDYATYQKPGSKSFSRYNQIRHIPGTTHKGQELRYKIPRGGGTAPFIPPALAQMFYDKKEIQTLILTEGAFKAAKGDIHGLAIIGLPSITHFKSSATHELHFDIKEIIRVCKVQNVVWLHDGDCRRITQKFPEETPDVDLYTRPQGFYRTVWNIKKLFEDFHQLAIYYASIKSDEIEGDPKGLDDLYVHYEKNFPAKFSEYCDDIRRELTKSSLAADNFHKFDVTSKMDHVRKWYCLENVNQFYLHHQGKIRDKEFFYNGTKYVYNDTTQHCDILIDKKTFNYVRVGTDYYKWIQRPNPHGVTDRVLEKWSKPTIMEDHGKGFCEHVQKLDAFCNVPDHVDYQAIISNCYNTYLPLKWKEREEGEWDTIRNFLLHIFGEDTITYTHPKVHDERTISGLELGLDYIQLLYKIPKQKLPILCLVSSEKETGKTTFGKLMYEIFGQNSVFVGNSDLVNDFNSSWSTKLLVMCEEVLIDKKLVMEKIKNLATNDKIMMNSKGKDQKEMDFYGKFIFMSNNEKSFINTDKEETRFWVRKIPRLTQEQKNPHLLTEMYDEIPAFLHYLDQRKMATENLTRSWFANALIKTEALQRIIEYSQPSIEKEIKEKMSQLFELQPQIAEILMATKDLAKEFFRNSRYDNRYINESCENLGVERLTRDGKSISKRYSYPVTHEYLDSAALKYKIDVIHKPAIGRPFVFKREDFIDPNITYDETLNEYIPSPPNSETNGQLEIPKPDDGKGDLPF
jgi:hypothetical protein